MGRTVRRRERRKRKRARKAYMRTEKRPEAPMVDSR